MTIYYNDSVERSEQVRASNPFNTRITCTIKGFIDESYGKYPESGADSVIIMEYNNFFPWVNQYLPDKM